MARCRIVSLSLRTRHDMNATGVALALFIGMLLPLQALINASLGKQTFGPVFASLASFMVGTGVLLAWWRGGVVWGTDDGNPPPDTFRPDRSGASCRQAQEAKALP